MDKNCGVELLGCAPEGLKSSVVQIQSIEPAQMFISVEMGANLRAAQTEFADATLQFARGEVGILQWNCRQTGEASGIGGHHLSNMIVKAFGKVESVRRFRPIA